MADAAMPSVATTDQRRRTVDRVFRGALVFNVALTAYWLFLLATGGSSAIFKNSRAGLEQVGAVLGFFLFFHVAWGFVWLGIKALVLKYVVGFSKVERRRAFSSRLEERFEVADFTARYSERRIRIADMIGRRGRFFMIGLSGFLVLYANLASAPGAQFATGFLTDNLFDAVIVSWLFLAFYYFNGFLAAAIYGPQSRVMDGVLARANCLLISTLWGAFKFVMVPVGTRLAAIYPPREFAPLYAFIWGSYIVSDACSEIVGSLFGRQRLRVWGMGDVNRKSVAGTVACFVSSLVLCLWVVAANGLAAPWIALSVLISISNAAFELLSPRGTDDFTMTVANALICWAFGAWLY
jgi:dolichol kinase